MMPQFEVLGVAGCGYVDKAVAVLAPHGRVRVVKFATWADYRKKLEMLDTRDREGVPVKWTTSPAVYRTGPQREFLGGFSDISKLY